MLGQDVVVDMKKCLAEFEECRKRAGSYLAERIEAFQNDGIKAEMKIAYGPVVKTILSTADEANSDLISLASHGLSALPRMFYGCVAAGLLQHIDRLLFMIRSAE